MQVFIYSKITLHVSGVTRNIQSDFAVNKYLRTVASSWILLTFKRRIKSHLPFADIIRSLTYSPRFHDKG